MNKNSTKSMSLILALWCASSIFPTGLATLKKDIQQKFDQAVTEEQAKFARNYGINPNDINKTLVTEFTVHLDGITKKDTDFYQSDFYKSKIDVQPEFLELIQSIATETLGKAGIRNVTVVHEPEFELGKVGIIKIYATGACYLKLNIEQYRDNKTVLKAILQHELAHIIYDDALVNQIFQALGWSNSQDSREQVEYNSLAISRACEIRADVYAILNSTPEEAEAYIKHMGTKEDPTVATTHPKTSERIAILQEIIKQLNRVAHP